MAPDVLEYPIFKKDTVLVYPTPAKNLINVQIPDDLQVHKITIVDLSGKILQQQTGSATEVNIENLAAGIYIIKIDSREISLISKLIKK